MLTHLGVLAPIKLLGFYKEVWVKGKLPTGWKESVIIPIWRPGKDPSNPNNYWPIAVTSHIRKDNGKNYYRDNCILFGK